MKKRNLLIIVTTIALLLLLTITMAFNTKPRDPDTNKLHVSGNRLIDENGSVLILRGLAYIDQVHGDRSTKMEEDFRVAAQEWCANVIRMPVHGTFYGDPEEYMKKWLDKQVDLCEKYNMYAVIDDHDDDERYLDDLKHFWNIVAPRYANRSHVIFEVLNEPSKGDNWQTWKNNAESVIDLIRMYDPNKVVIINGLDWGYELSYVLSKPIERTNVIYGTHPYPNKFWHCGGLDATEEEKRAEWTRAFGKIADRYPVLVTEFGWDGYTNQVWGNGNNEQYAYPLLKYLDERGIGYLAWSWSNLYGPALLSDFDSYTPSYSGAVIKAHLQEHNAP